MLDKLLMAIMADIALDNIADNIADYRCNAKDCLNELRLFNQEIIRGVLLYTDEDNNLKHYIEKHFQEFHKLSGDWCKIYILEKPCKEWRKRNLPLTERFKLKFVRKIDKSEAYDIARELKININQIPCLILFGKEVNFQRLIFPIKEVSLKELPIYFRELFSKIEEILRKVSEENSYEYPFETISDYFDDIKNYLDKYAQRIDSQIQYLYQEQNIFIQKTVNDASMTFQRDVNDTTLAGGRIKIHNSSHNESSS